MDGKIWVVRNGKRLGEVGFGLGLSRKVAVLSLEAKYQCGRGGSIWDAC